MIAAPLLLTLFSLAPIFSLGAQRKKRLCPGLAPRPNIKLLPSPHLNSYDFPTCFAIWVFVSLSLHFYTVTISVSPFTPGVGLFTRSSMPERKMPNLIITSFGRKLLVAILRSFTCGQTIRRRMCSLKAYLPLASSSCVTTGYSTMEMSRGEWPYRKKVGASSGQMLNESLGESLDPAHLYHCSIKTGPKKVFPRLVITPRVFAAFISTIKHAPLRKGA